MKDPEYDPERHRAAVLRSIADSKFMVSEEGDPKTLALLDLLAEKVAKIGNEPPPAISSSPS